MNVNRSLEIARTKQLGTRPHFNICSTVFLLLNNSDLDRLQFTLTNPDRRSFRYAIFRVQTQYVRPFFVCPESCLTNVSREPNRMLNAPDCWRSRSFLCSCFCSTQHLRGIWSHPLQTRPQEEPTGIKPHQRVRHVQSIPHQIPSAWFPIR